MSVHRANAPELKTAYGLSYHIDALNRADCAGLLKGAHVLEVGGALPRELVLGEYGAGSWTAVDNISAYAAITGVRGADLPALSEASAPAPEGGYVAFDGDCSALPCTLRRGTFDVVLSLATFEHIGDLSTALDQARDALRSAGTLLAQVGPIWTGWRGHHVFPDYFGVDSDKTRDMLDRMVPWQHLLMDAREMAGWLANRYGRSFAATVIESIYESPRINRLTFNDYGRAFVAASFEQADLLVNGAPAPYEWRRALEPALRDRFPAESRFDVDCFWVTLRAPV